MSKSFRLAFSPQPLFTLRVLIYCVSRVTKIFNSFPPARSKNRRKPRSLAWTIFYQLRVNLTSRALLPLVCDSFIVMEFKSIYLVIGKKHCTHTHTYNIAYKHRSFDILFGCKKTRVGHVSLNRTKLFSRISIKTTATLSRQT